MQSEHCIDYRGRRIEVTDAARRHILNRHPEMAPYLSRICEALAEPDLVYSRRRPDTHLYYKLGVCSDEFTSSYFVVYVRYNTVGRWVTTAHSTSVPNNVDFLIYERVT